MPLVDLIEVSNKQFTFAANCTICNAYNIMRSVCGHSAELGSVRPLAGVRRICFGVEFLVELIEVSNGPVYLCREPFANHELVMFCNLRPVMRFLFINLAVIRCPFGCMLSSFGAHSGLLVRSFGISLPAPDCPILARGPQSHVRSDPIGPRSGV